MIHPSALSPLPRPQGHPLVGALPAFRRDPVAFIRQAAALGDIVDLPLGQRSGTLVTHPDLVKEVISHRGAYEKGGGAEGLGLFMGDGSDAGSQALWHVYDSSIYPIWYQIPRAGIVEAMASAIAAALDAFPLNGRTSIQKHATHLTLEVAARVFFGTSTRGDVATLRNSIEALIDYTGQRELAPVQAPGAWPTPANRRFAAAVAALDKLVYRLIDHHEGRAEPGNLDLLDVLLLARDQQTGEGLSDQQIRDELLAMFVTVVESTANTMCWAWSLLGKYPEQLEKVAGEAMAVLSPALPTVDEIARLDYTSMVVKETLRLYPPAWLLWRQAMEAGEIGGHAIPVGRRVYLSPFVTQRLPMCWEAPEAFRPDRFMPEYASNYSAYTLFPFGGGPRRFICSDLTVLVTTLTLAMMSQRACMIRASELPEPRAQLSLRPGAEVLFYATPR